MQDDLDEVCGHPLQPPARQPIHPTFKLLDPTKFVAALGEDFDWGKEEIPFFDLDGAPDVVAAYYYRWRVLRKHMKWTQDGWVCRLN